MQGAVNYVAVNKQKHNQIVPPCPRGPITKTATLLDRMRRKLQTILGRKIYAWRKAIVEPCSDRSSAGILLIDGFLEIAVSVIEG